MTTCSFADADSPDFKPRVNWSRFHETMPLADMARDPYAMSPTALKTNTNSMTSTDGVNGIADISGVPQLPGSLQQDFAKCVGVL